MSDAPTILLVDDEPDILEIFAMELEYAGFNIEPASSGSEAIEKFKKGGIAAILSDIRMADGDGITLLEQVRAISPANPPLLFMTGFADINQQEALDKGAAGFFHKPIDGTTLVEGIQHALLPKDQLWRTKPKGAERATEVNLALGSMSEAMANGHFTIGQGGLFIHVSDFSGRVGKLVSFDLTFSSGEAVKGLGTVKWHRKTDDGTFKKGIGIEIDFLEDPAITLVCNQLASHPTKAFIPLS